ncbi:MAG TPA: 3-deoxy-7-phosphoheptulonate synthase [Mycobacteriales bacterium]|nr:3-deoxy-7-phosphoheptulonate synthase [Mycobacteriales bacterium]
MTTPTQNVETSRLEADRQVRDRRIGEIRPLVSPALLRDELPLAPGSAEIVVAGRDAVTGVLAGTDDRLLVVVGPCSVHDPVAGLEYARHLAELAPRLSGELQIVMRVYFEKPRSTLGWKGLINDPGLDNSYNVNAGLRIARKLLLDILALGLPAGCEFLDPITPQYIADTVSWGSIGARTAASQVHRQLASGLSMPIGIKNSTDGDVQIAVDAVAAAAGSHVFTGITDDGVAAILSTRGNPDCHVVLRGSSAGPNYDAESVAQAVALLEKAQLPGRVIVDASHGNSGKDPRRQPAVAADIAARLAAGDRSVVGLMLESFLVEGNQPLDQTDPTGLVYGKSITDGCLSWETTAQVLTDLAAAVAARRSA